FTLFVVFYWSSINNLFKLWDTDPTYSHGLLVPFLSIYLIAQKNKSLTSIALKPAPLLLLPLVLTVFLWLLASITDIRVIEITLLPLIFFFAYTSIIGYKSSLVLATSLLYILFAVPIWSLLTPYLQSMAVFINELALQLNGIPTNIKNNTVSIPAGTFKIESGCAGTGYLVVTLTIGGFFSLSNFKRIKPALILLAASFILPIIFNWIRIYIIILIGHFTDMQSPLISDHNNFGWILYGISLIPLFYLAKQLVKAEDKKQQRQLIDNQPDILKYLYPKFFILIPVILIISAPALTTYLSNSRPDTLQETPLPKAEAPWLGPIYFNDWTPKYRGASIETNRLYIGMNKAPDISLHIYYYGQQTQDSELINKLNTITDDDMIESQKIFTFENHNIIENIIISNSKKRLVWYWYYVNNKNIVSPIIAKLFQARELISGKASSSLIALSTECDNQCNKKKLTLTDFLEKHHSQIIDSLSM
ncbi:MAG: EpsI family protein, partial [Gammaproteobacteria bacterium]|nr:EpsI family protein [Gammaproteobacteria bacterium]